MMPWVVNITVVVVVVYTCVIRSFIKQQVIYIKNNVKTNQLSAIVLSHKYIFIMQLITSFFIFPGTYFSKFDHYFYFDWKYFCRGQLYINIAHIYNYILRLCRCKCPAYCIIMWCTVVKSTFLIIYIIYC